MALYRVERELGQITQDELDAAAFRAAACLPHFEGLAWLRSYVNPDLARMTCYYEARAPEDIWRHAEMAHLPCDAVAGVVELLPDPYH